jgi:hypothetical protein
VEEEGEVVVKADLLCRHYTNSWNTYDWKVTVTSIAVHLLHRAVEVVHCDATDRSSHDPPARRCLTETKYWLRSSALLGQDTPPSKKQSITIRKANSASNGGQAGKSVGKHRKKTKKKTYKKKFKS